MSILIKDMEMPKKCGECAIYVRYRTWNDDPGDEFCGMTKENVSYKTKPDWCPLSEVPERKTGTWSVYDRHTIPYQYICSECGAYHRARYDFCPSCGACMRI